MIDGRSYDAEIEALERGALSLERQLDKADAARWKAEEEVKRLTAELELTRKQLETAMATVGCNCWTSPMAYEGPAADCPVHGAIAALNEAHREIARLIEERDAALLSNVLVECSHPERDSDV